MTSLLLEKDFTAGECTCFVCWGGGGGLLPPRLWWLFPWWTGCRITCLLDALRKRTPQTFENCLWHFFRKWLYIVVVEERLFGACARLHSELGQGASGRGRGWRYLSNTGRWSIRNGVASGAGIEPRHMAAVMASLLLYMSFPVLWVLPNQ